MQGYNRPDPTPVDLTSLSQECAWALRSVPFLFRPEQSGSFILHLGPNVCQSICKLDCASGSLLGNHGLMLICARRLKVGGKGFAEILANQLPTLTTVVPAYKWTHTIHPMLFKGQVYCINNNSHLAHLGAWTDYRFPNVLKKKSQ